jgi:hypothetical protein
MKFYTIIFEKDGETIATFSVHADSESDAQLPANKFFREHPEHRLADNEGVTVRVEEKRSPR